MVLVVSKAILAATIMCISVHQSAGFASQCVFFFVLLCAPFILYVIVIIIGSGVMAHILLESRGRKAVSQLQLL